jgi:hypothetical protein
MASGPECMEVEKEARSCAGWGGAELLSSTVGKRGKRRLYTWAGHEIATRQGPSALRFSK